MTNTADDVQGAGRGAARDRIQTALDIGLFVGLTATHRAANFTTRAFGWLGRRSAALTKKTFDLEFRSAYRAFSRVSFEHEDFFMDYGIVVPTDEAPQLEAADEPDRLSIQLYHRAVAGVDLAGSDVLEVSCGHGGGSRYLARYLRPRRIVGLDLNPEGVALCRHHHHEPGLEYQVGNAIDLPFEDASFDAVVSVEASHCYPSFAQFVHEVERVLRPGGHLMLVDLRWVDGGLETMRRELERSGLQLIEFEDLTQKVIASLDASVEQRRRSLSATVPKLLLRTALANAAVPGSPQYQGFVDGSSTYSRFLLRKPIA